MRERKQEERNETREGERREEKEEREGRERRGRERRGKGEEREGRGKGEKMAEREGRGQGAMAHHFKNKQYKTGVKKVLINTMYKQAIHRSAGANKGCQKLKVPQQR